MNPANVTRAAFGSALLLHAILFSVGRLAPTPPEPEQQISIRFTSIEERALSTLPLPQAIPVQETRPTPVSPLPSPVLPEPVRPREPARVPVPSPVPIPPSQPPADHAPAVAAPPRPAPAVAAVAPVVPQAAVAAPAAPQPHPESLPRRQEAAPAPSAKPSGRLSDYLASVRGMVENNREYPAAARQLGHQGTVTVRVTIGADGSLAEVVVSATAGHKSLDRAAVSAVKRAAPFKSPGAFGLGKVTLEIPIVYRLT